MLFLEIKSNLVVLSRLKSMIREVSRSRDWFVEVLHHGTSSDPASLDLASS